MAAKGALAVLIVLAGCSSPPTPAGGASPMGDAAAPADMAMPAAQPSPDLATAQNAGSGLKLLTLNMQNPAINTTHADQRFQMFVALIQAEQPDFVSLQEAIEDGQGNRAEMLAQATGYSFIWSKGQDLFAYKEGPAVLSKTTITWHDEIDLPHEDLFGTVTRQLIGVRAMTAHGEIYFYGSHMTLDSSETVKADQAEKVIDLAKAHPSPRASFFAGDLNAEPDTLAMKLLRGEATHHGKTGTFVDAWTTANPNDVGYTIPSDNPERRIDYIYVIPGTSSAGTVTRCKKVLDQPMAGVFASDHVAVLCEVTP